MLTPIAQFQPLLQKLGVLIEKWVLPLEIGVNLDSDRLKTITQAVSEHMRFSAERARFSAEQAHVNFL